MDYYTISPLLLTHLKNLKKNYDAKYEIVYQQECKHLYSGFILIKGLPKIIFFLPAESITSKYKNLGLIHFKIGEKRNVTIEKHLIKKIKGIVFLHDLVREIVDFFSKNTKQRNCFGCH